uniref:Uncharacterized protein n=1 Tax=Romanomermis culicivorax TaxID=13658 RepID=A0A915KAJ5_ROMCU
MNLGYKSALTLKFDKSWRGRRDDETSHSYKAYHTVESMKQADKGQAVRIKDLKTQINAIKIKIGEHKKLIADYTAQNEILRSQLDNLPNDNPSLDQVVPNSPLAGYVSKHIYVLMLSTYDYRLLSHFFYEFCLADVMNENSDQNRKKIVEKFERMEKYFDLVDKCETMKVEREKEC